LKVKKKLKKNNRIIQTPNLLKPKKGRMVSKEHPGNDQNGAGGKKNLQTKEEAGFKAGKSGKYLTNQKEQGTLEGDILIQEKGNR